VCCSTRRTRSTAPSHHIVLLGSQFRRRGERIGWLICGATIAIWAATYLTWPFSNDQGNLAWVGDVILSGGMPYRDAWDVKGPGAHLLFALQQLAFGRNEWGVRLFDLLMLVLGAFSLRRITAVYAGPAAARWAIALYILWYASLNHHNTAQPDGWAGVMVTAAVALMLTGTQLSPRAGAAAGVLIAVCALIKPTYAMFLVLPALAAIARARSNGRGRVLWFWCATALGFALPLALCILWFTHQGALGDWIDIHLRWIPSTYTQVDSAWLNRGQALIVFLTAEQFAPAIPLVVGGLYVVRHRSRPDMVLLLIWVAFAILGVLIQGQFYPYHWLPLYPPLAVLAGLGIDAVWKWLTDDRPVALASSRADAAVREPAVLRTVGAALVAIVLMGAETSPAVHVYRYARSAASHDFSGYEQIEFGPFGHSGGVFSELVKYLRLESSPDDGVLLWGSAAGVNYLANRAAVSPFGFVQPLVDPADTKLRRSYRDHFMARLTSAPPRYVVALNAATCARDPSTAERQLLGRAEGLMRCLSDIPDVSWFVSEHYTMVRPIGPLEVWRRR